MWCLRCYEPVRHLTPREPQLPPLCFPGPKETPPTSRWHRGPTTFGPVGRLAITAVVLSLGPWNALTGFGSAVGGLVLWYLLGYLFVAVLVLKHVWRREPMVAPGRATGGVRSRIARRLPRLGRSITLPPLVVLTVLGVIAFAVLAIVWIVSDTTVRYYIVAVGVSAGTGLFLVTWNEL